MANEEDINHRAFALIKKMLTWKREDAEHSEELEGSMKEKGAVDWSSKLDRFGVARGQTYGVTNAIFYVGPTTYTGFVGKLFTEFQILASDILILPEFNEKTSTTFMEDIVFDWMFKIKQSGTAQQSLINYVRDEYEGVVKNYEFYFPVLNLDIKIPFTIGNVEFTFFSKEYMDDFFKSVHKKITEDQFNEIYRKEFQGSVITKVVVTAESRKAEALAKRQAELAVDVLKIITFCREIPDKSYTFELGHRLGYPVKNLFLTKEKERTFDYSIGLSWNNSNHPVFDENFLRAARELGGLNILSDFITLDHDNELYRFIINGIELLSFALSLNNLNRRAVELITVLESLMLKIEKENEMAKKTKKRISNFLIHTTEEKRKMLEVFDYVYNIRHEMVHKANPIQVNAFLIRDAQVHLLYLIFRLVDANLKGNYKEKGKLIDAIDALPN